MNSFDPGHYGYDGALSGCENDARDMAAIAGSRGFEVRTLLTAQATRAAVLNQIADAARTLRSGDIFMLSYAGHGSNVRDENNDETDELRMDETWCLYDGQLLDDELYGAWADFEAGVRILVFSDSCNSGTILRMTPGDFGRRGPELHELDRRFRELQQPLKRIDDPKLRKLVAKQSVRGDRRRVAQPRGAVAKPRIAELKLRSLPPSILAATFQRNRSFYESIGQRNVAGDRAPVVASLILISGCQDDQYSADGSGNGLFTQTLKEVWNDGRFTADHPTFHNNIREQLPSFQQPNYMREGAPNTTFEHQIPFTI